MYKSSVDSKVSGSAVSIGLALLKETCWYKIEVYILHSANLQILKSATKPQNPCVTDREILI